MHNQNEKIVTFYTENVYDSITGAKIEFEYPTYARGRQIVVKNKSGIDLIPQLWHIPYSDIIEVR